MAQSKWELKELSGGLLEVYLHCADGEQQTLMPLFLPHFKCQLTQAKYETSFLHLEKMPKLKKQQKNKQTLIFEKHTAHSLRINTSHLKHILR